MTLRLLLALAAPLQRHAWACSLLISYFSHALVWAGVGALWARCTAFSAATQHLLWKLALLAPLATALLSTALPMASEHTVGRSPATREIALPSFDHPNPARAAEANGGPPERWQGLLLAGTLGVSGLGLVRFGSSLFLLSRRLRGRTPVRALGPLARFQRLRRRLQLGPIALTESDKVSSPLVVGVREVCLPRGLREALSEAELDAVFAHELCHLKRGDALWFPVVSLLCSLLWMQPINRWLKSRFRQTAELACDDAAVALTHDASALARALLRVAECSLPAARFGLVPTMRGSSRVLRERIERLVRPGRKSGRQGLRPMASASLVVVLLGTAGLNVSLAAPRAESNALTALPTVPPEPEEPPDPARANARIRELLQSEDELAVELEAARQAPFAERETSAAAVRVLELEQRLAHLRATEAWIEERFRNDWASWEKQKLASEPTAR